MSIVWSLIAGAAVVLSALNVAPQLIKSFRTKKTQDLAYGMMIIIMAGNILWMIHGIHINDWAILVANIILFLTAITLTFMKYFYDKRNKK
jgi:MtN3 and saliva related transmembrane protein